MQSSLGMEKEVGRDRCLTCNRKVLVRLITTGYWTIGETYAYTLSFHLFFKSFFKTFKGKGRGRGRLPAGSLMQDSIPGTPDCNLSQRQTLNHLATQAPSNNLLVDMYLLLVNFLLCVCFLKFSLVFSVFVSFIICFFYIVVYLEFLLFIPCIFISDF